MRRFSNGTESNNNLKSISVRKMGRKDEVEDEDEDEDEDENEVEI